MNKEVIMKKLSALCLITTLVLTACQQPNSEAPEQSNQTATPTEQTHDHNHDHAHTHEHEHDNHEHHEHGDHAHNHDHAHHDGDKYQCGDKAVHIAVHDHEGEIEAHLTYDGITYDLTEDVQTKGRFTSDDGIMGENKGMVLTMSDDKATLATLDGTTTLECTKS